MMNNLIRSCRSLINGCYHPARCSGISKGQFPFMPLGLGQIRGGETKRDIGMGPMGKMMPTYRATNALLTISGCGAVLTVFCLPEVGRCR